MDFGHGLLVGVRGVMVRVDGRVVLVGWGGWGADSVGTSRHGWLGPIAERWWPIAGRVGRSRAVGEEGSEVVMEKHMNRCGSRNGGLVGGSEIGALRQSSDHCSMGSGDGAMAGGCRWSLPRVGSRDASREWQSASPALLRGGGGP